MKKSATNILIVGSHGIVGEALTKACAEAGLSWLGTSRSRGDKNSPWLDLSQPFSHWELPDKCDIAIICAAETRVEKCERDPTGTRFINLDQTLLLAKELRHRGAALIFPTTSLDSVSTEYGRQKAAVERALPKISDRVAIVRLSKVVHPGFTLFRQWYTALQNHEIITPFEDYFFSPILLSEVIKEFMELIRNFKPDTWQLSGDRSLSYAEAAYLLAKQNCFPSHLVLPQPRPSSNPLTKPNSEHAYHGPLNGNVAPSVSEALKTVFQQISLLP